MGKSSLASGASDSYGFLLEVVGSSDGSGERAGGGGNGGGCCIGGGGRAGGDHFTLTGGEEVLDRSCLRFKDSPADLTYEPDRSKGGLPSTEGDLESLDGVGGEGRGRGGPEAGLVFT